MSEIFKISEQNGITLTDEVKKCYSFINDYLDKKDLSKWINYTLSKPDNKKGLLFIGQTGSGKTTALKMYQKAAIKKEGNKGFLHAKEMQYNYCENEALIKAWGRARLPQTDSFYNHFNDGLNELIIDDFGVEEKLYGKEWLAGLIEVRFLHFEKHGLKTHFSTMFPMNQILDRYGAHIHGRLIQMCNIIPLGITKNYKNFRLEK